MTILDDISSAVQRGKRKEVAPLVQQALDEGLDPVAILNDGLVPAMSVIGEKFSAGEAFVPEMLVAARAMAAGTEVLKPRLAEAGAEPLGKAVIGTVRGDMHDIGKNLVRMMIESKGFEVTDLGVDVAPEQFVTFLQEHEDTDIVCCSALLTTTMPEIGATIRAIEEAGLRDRVKVMIGGAPVTQAFADEVGADAYTVDAGAAAVRAVELVRG
ncbi:corrinoid protein [Adlercreutzia faecimuris]|uniref:Corrinoid protein n=1 Tax=Adlercreutzia faecimuris TaxID=2897341 RepID=A0ABS9WES7_9ACTN|nr:corrinoid protein [Adlercreutzia sp. JBNU-10]MCI2241368.1 corrinoid protein [Adlercreutzia sp. JBNU-10]